MKRTRVYVILSPEGKRAGTITVERSDNEFITGYASHLAYQLWCERNRCTGQGYTFQSLRQWKEQQEHEL